MIPHVNTALARSLIEVIETKSCHHSILFKGGPSFGHEFCYQNKKKIIYTGKLNKFTVKIKHSFKYDFKSFDMGVWVLTFNERT